MERQGRSVAWDLNIPWCEYWAFFDEFFDLSTDDGLEKLENYFREQRDNMSEEASTPDNNTSSTTTASPGNNFFDFIF